MLNKLIRSIALLAIIVPKLFASSHGCYVSNSDPFNCYSQQVICSSDLNANFNLYGYTLGAACEAIVTQSSELRAEQALHTDCQKNLNDNLEKVSILNADYSECKNNSKQITDKLDSCYSGWNQDYTNRYADGFNTCVTSCNEHITRANNEIRRLAKLVLRLRKQKRI